MGQYLRLRAGQGITAQVIISGEPFAGDVSEAITHLISTRSALVIPIANPDTSPAASGRPLGVLNIESPVENGLTAATLQLVMQPALLERLTHILQTPPTIEQRLDALVDLDTTKTEGVYTQILTLMNDYIGKPDLSGAITLLRDREENLAQAVAIQQWADDPRWIVVQGTFGTYRTDEPDRRLNRPSITRRVLTTGKAVISADVQSDPDYWPVGEGLHSMVAVPIFDHETPIGTLEVLHPQFGTFDEDDVEKLQRVSVYVGQLIKRITDLEAAQRAESKLEYTAQLRELTAPLYEWQQLNREGIDAMRDSVLSRILHWALPRRIPSTARSIKRKRLRIRPNRISSFVRR